MSLHRRSRSISLSLLTRGAPNPRQPTRPQTALFPASWAADGADPAPQGRVRAQVMAPPPPLQVPPWPWPLLQVPLQRQARVGHSISLSPTCWRYLDPTTNYSLVMRSARACPAAPRARRPPCVAVQHGMKAAQQAAAAQALLPAAQHSLALTRQLLPPRLLRHHVQLPGGHQSVERLPL